MGKKSAELKEPEAQYLVGEAFLNGRGVEKSSEQANYWFQKAAKNGFSSAFEALKKTKSSEAGDNVSEAVANPQ